ncbi:unnamed protein product [Vitrella brassicaformis CCMP3155]|uniref:Rhomboid-like protease n=1 Tax=Vitrella brassicaformis (strain CCMP3155) TaxID=1169540 RepID=A0A0G4GER0_VITBC|nr:unnamed protein product [Vitrella brassicaformis CCMP3155]|mmetsp:Transcript_27354/g.68283  ORF Transcript_27354/g.68283 Transcript_27354/m.68283 type:complete len:297 (+) Transcript_27354:1628-2518(+)|eukprot:CEM27832.1 unnamed protein product [Vitrella brassicaformis CCMP3155]
MPNVHRLTDYQQQRNEGTPLPTVAASGGSGDIRFVDMFFPGCTWQLHIVWLSMIQMVVYFLSLIPGQERAAPTRHSLLLFGCSYGPNLQRGEVWRLFMPIFLHANLSHLLMNVFVQIAMGMQVEQKYGIGRFHLIYFGSGILANLFSTAVHPCNTAVGASTSGFGIIGAQIAEVVLIWHLLSGMSRSRAIYQLIFFAVYLVFFMLFVTSQGTNLDHFGHLGGALAGFFLLFLIYADQENKPSWYQTGRRVALACLFVMAVGSTLALCFETDIEKVVDPKTGKFLGTRHCEYVPPPY